MIPSDSALFPTLLAVLVVAALAIKRKLPFDRTFLLLTLTAYIGSAIAVTLFPLPIDPRLIHDRASEPGLHNNLLPLATILGAAREDPRIAAWQLGGNLVLSIPAGLMLPALWPRFRSAPTTIACLVAASLTVEVTQLLISMLLGYTYRQFDVDDILLNAAGGAVGFSMWWIAHAVAQRVNHSRLPG